MTTPRQHFRPQTPASASPAACQARTAPSSVGGWWPAPVVRVTKVAVGPISDEEAAGIVTFGDIRAYAPALAAG